jgi:hypothetical protein
LNTNELFCVECGSDNVQKRGYTSGGKKQKIRCNDCGKFGLTERVGEIEEETLVAEQASYSFMSDGEKAQISTEIRANEDEIQTADDLIRHLKIDTSIWQIDRFKIGKSTAYRKDREVKWDVVDGKVVSGHVDDSGELLLKPLFNVQVWMSRKTEEIRAGMAIEDFSKMAYQYAPRQVSLKYTKPKSGMLYEIEMPDIHIGKLTWGEESGEDSDIKIQVDAARAVIESLLSHTQHYPIERILFPLGHDFYNVDNNLNTTTHGTPQQEDTRWRKTFRIGWNLAAEMVNMCAQVAPVDVYIIGGNHDEQRSFYLGEVLSALYANTDRVNIDNSAKLRKYYAYGKVLLGLTHGYHEKLKELKDIILYEAKPYLGEAEFIEWHTGDKHHKEDYVHKTHEASNGVVVRILRSLTSPDAWHYNKGYNGALRASEAFMWDRDNGLVAQFTASPKSP